MDDSYVAQRPVKTGMKSCWNGTTKCMAPIIAFFLLALLGVQLYVIATDVTVVFDPTAAAAKTPKVPAVVVPVAPVVPDVVDPVVPEVEVPVVPEVEVPVVPEVEVPVVPVVEVPVVPVETVVPEETKDDEIVVVEEKAF